MSEQLLLRKMSQNYPNSFVDDVMSFLEKIESSFQEAVAFLEGSKYILDQKGYGKDLDATIESVQMAKEYVSHLREKLPSELDAAEDAFITQLIQERAERRPN